MIFPLDAAIAMIGELSVNEMAKAFYDVSTIRRSKARQLDLISEPATGSKCGRQGGQPPGKLQVVRYSWLHDPRYPNWFFDRGHAWQGLKEN